VVSSSTTVAYSTSPAQLQNFGSIQVSLPKESKNVEGQAYLSWAEAKAKFMARTNREKPKILEDNNNDYTTPTFDELPTENRQAYEIIKKKREEKHLQECLANLNKDRQDKFTQVGEIKSPPRGDQVEPSTKLRQEKAMLIHSINEENTNDSASMVNLVIVKAESKSTCAESIESKEASFVEQEQGKISKTPLFDFSGCKGSLLAAL
jgi:hypothetical protein